MSDWVDRWQPFSYILIMYTVLFIVFSIACASPVADCKPPMIRIEVLFPVRQVGCWAGQPLNGNHP